MTKGDLISFLNRCYENQLVCHTMGEEAVSKREKAFLEMLYSTNHILYEVLWEMRKQAKEKQ